MGVLISLHFLPKAKTVLSLEQCLFSHNARKTPIYFLHRYTAWAAYHRYCLVLPSRCCIFCTHWKYLIFQIFDGFR